MREWLLKDEEKNPVGRPKLAREDVLKKAKASIYISIAICIMLSVCFFAEMKDEDPLKFTYHLTFEKLFGAIENKNGFIVKEKYDNESNYVMEVSIPSVIDRYQGSYRYTLYEMDGNSWKEKETKEIEKKAKNFKIKIDSLKNQNKTWKIKLQIINASKISETYEPAGWSFMDSSKSEDKYAYKIFTVKGYYSPVTKEEIKESINNKDKISVSTNKNEPRKFILLLPTNNTYDVKVTYTDVSGKNVILKEDSDVNGNISYTIPNINRASIVTFKVKGFNTSSLKLSSWKEGTDKSGDKVIKGTYVLKPERAY